MSVVADFLPYGRQTITEEDIRAVVQVLRSDFLTTGPEVARLEAALVATCNSADAIAVANGTAALHLALQAFGVGEGDSVVVPTVTFLATANVVRLVGAEVVFADVDPVTGLLTEQTCREALTRAKQRVKAIVPVHLGGRIVDMAAIRKVADDIGAMVLEDACHAIGGSEYVNGRPTPVGSCTFSEAAAFSFHPVKTITAGEGGAVTCRTPQLAERLRRVRNHGMERLPEKWSRRELGFDSDGANPWYYEMPEIGLNYRLTDIQCALAASQLGRLKALVARRKSLADLYDAALGPLSDIVVPAPRLPGQDGGWHLYQVSIDFNRAGRSRAQVMRTLHERGIGTQVHYVPVHLQPYYRNRYGEQRLIGAEQFYARTLSLPLFPAMQDTDVPRVVDALEAILLRQPARTRSN